MEVSMEAEVCLTRFIEFQQVEVKETPILGKNITIELGKYTEHMGLKIALSS